MWKEEVMSDEQFIEAMAVSRERLFRLCCRYFGNRDDANDALQDIILKIWSNRKSFRGEAQPSTWMYRVAVNVCLTSLKGMKKHVRLEDGDRLACDQPDHSEEEKDEKEKSEEKISFFNDFMERLSSVDRILVSLYLEDVDSQSIAGVTGLSDTNVRTRIHRIKSQIKKEWEESHES